MTQMLLSVTSDSHNFMVVAKEMLKGRTRNVHTNIPRYKHPWLFIRQLSLEFPKPNLRHHVTESNQAKLPASFKVVLNFRATVDGLNLTIVYTAIFPGTQAT